MPIAAPYVWWRGGRFDENSIPSLLVAEKKSGLPIRVTQGGYNKGVVTASAGTHDGGAVIDISVKGWDKAQINKMLLWLRRVGWAAWYRTPAQGFTPHIHAVRNEDASASWGARAQVVAYKLRLNGLANRFGDDGPYVPYYTWSTSPYNPKNIPKPKPKPTVTINGKTYPDISSVSAAWINESRKHKTFSRHTYYLEGWLTKLGYNSDGKNNGKWSAGLQKDLDDFRWDNRKALGISNRAGAGGSVGIGSLTLLRNKAGSKRKVRKDK